MAYQTPKVAPKSGISAASQGRVVGRFCLDCGCIYPQHSRRHAGKPMHGKDHISCPCSHEGQAFAPNESWWEPAVEVLTPEAQPEPPEQPIP